MIDMPSHGRLYDCLQSLRVQTIDPKQFVIIISNPTLVSLSIHSPEKQLQDDSFISLASSQARESLLLIRRGVGMLNFPLSTGINFSGDRNEPILSRVEILDADRPVGRFLRV